ncbi:GNAT family N-acetyltransferase [Pedobacter frigiditerrae]|uniref:GNAT family N-acetyltransferase n=1 Tax=Pedobacter frigiditerrae TaxID=2530452 RepID=A0A4V2MJB5_9SPHI|nr:GNAT family N-acetyltransferase [Pedobacter frigiditerrae]TCC93596.1 GNAT family N-acetyltransferase [Pedobacter frigiditerrae]
MILLRRGKTEDMPIVADLAERIWPNTYGQYISEEQINYMLKLMYNQGELLTQLEKGYVFLMASEEDKDVGFACYSIVDTESDIYKLHKIYVLPEMHGKGVGKILMNEVINLAKRKGGKSLELNVNKNNKSKDFYLKSGFKINESVTIDIGNGFVMDDFVMELQFS